MLYSSEIADANYQNQISTQTDTPILMPLRDRDWEVLAEFFERGDIEEIEANINKNLQMMMPEPCWEDHPFDFLGEYL